MEQGELGDSAYLCISGPLRVYVRDEDGTQRMAREMSRGEVIGEMSLYTGEPAIRHGRRTTQLGVGEAG